ncbi:MAG: MBG domain-containing protein [Daejeonella sp.]|uniref:MBG domain-containing protein n=1 Tax=Daejeonella sp. TaxID=2805397 RepID=UPI0027346120|nr:MBG domain-containing protein [Daejeonella sp.]MDP3469452.1 MBG domain-containing protein [Daejeonella sp.]
MKTRILSKSEYFHLNWIYAIGCHLFFVSVSSTRQLTILSQNSLILRSVLSGVIISLNLLFFTLTPGYCAGKAPVIICPKVIDTGADWISVQGEILVDEGNSITEKGFIFSKGQGDDQQISAGSGFGIFTIKLTNLKSDKTYHITPYAIHSGGLTYGPAIEGRVGDNAPLFISKLISTVNYDEIYQSVIKVQSPGNLETKVIAKKKPEWLTLSSEAEVQTLAGSGSSGSVNGPALSASFRTPYALASDTSGNIYIADQLAQNIRKINTSGEVSLLAGGNKSGFQDGIADEARFNSPSGIAIDRSGNVYISDQNNHSIRKISPLGIVSTFAGNGTPGYADGTGGVAHFKYPAGLAVDAIGNVYVADRGNNLIRVINANGKVSTLAGTRATGFADGAALSAMFNAPTGIAISSSGDLFIADQVNNRIRKIDQAGQVSTVAGSGTFTYFDAMGTLAGFRYPTGITLGSDGSLYVTDQLNHNVRRISKDGLVSTVAGTEPGFSEGSGSSAKFRNPSGICTAPSGELYIADFYNYRIRKIINDPVLFGTPAKSDVGSYEVVLAATNESATAIQSFTLVVRDILPPQVNSFSPANGATSVSRSPDLMLTFDEEIFLSDTGSVTVYKGSEVLKKLDLKIPDQRAKLVLSSDRKSLQIEDVRDLPSNSAIRILFSKGLISDSLKNEFNGLSNWHFTIQKAENQKLEIQALSEKIYGDSAFSIGPELSSAGLPIIYVADEPAIITISGNVARILKAGRTGFTAIQKGDANFLPLELKGEVLVKARPIIIQPVQGQSKKYGQPDFDISFNIKSGTIVNEDLFKGKLSRETGESVGVYPILAGNLALSPDYNLTILPGNISIEKAALKIIADDKTKIIGAPDPEFTVSYVGFVNGDGIACLTDKPQVISSVPTGTVPGNYKLIVSAATAKNYDITFQEGKLMVIFQEVPDFFLKEGILFENQPLNSLAGVLITAVSDAKMDYTMAIGDGDTDNSLFQIQGNKILTRTLIDYETTRECTLRIRATGNYGEFREKIIRIAIADINEMPKMDAISDQKLCMTGQIVLNGISGGPEANQRLSVVVKSPDLKLFSILKVSDVINGKAIITYSVAKSSTRSARLEIMLKDDGGIKNGGIDSAVYHYILSFQEPPVLAISSDRGTTIIKGETVLLSANGNGSYTWSDEKGVLAGQNSSFLRVNPLQSTVYKARMTSESGCVTEKEISILVRENTEPAFYNVITPNEDGINDFFTAKNIDLFPQNDLKVFDKSGTVVYAKINYRNEWKGERNGMPLPTGTYYYLLEFNQGKERVKGFVLILND